MWEESSIINKNESFYEAVCLQKVEKEKGSLVRAQLTLELVRRDSFASVHLHTHTHACIHAHAHTHTHTTATATAPPPLPR